jgi:hypothetical protein
MSEKPFSGVGGGPTFNIWIKPILRYKYVTFDNIKLILKHIPIGKIAVT